MAIQQEDLEITDHPDCRIIILRKTCRILDFAFPADHKTKLKVSEKRDKYLDLARELKKMWNMRVTVIPIVINVQSTKDWYREWRI